MKISSAALWVALVAGVPAGASTLVAANDPAPTLLGSFAAGEYHITATGIVDLAGGGTFEVNPDGTPAAPITSPGYGYCNPSGCDYDAVGGSYGVGGPGRNLGAVLGTLTAFPAVPGSYFLIGNGVDITLAAAGDIYAQVNDTFYSNDIGSFTVDVSAVPEPATWGLFLLGFGLTGVLARRNRAGIA